MKEENLEREEFILGSQNVFKNNLYIIIKSYLYRLRHRHERFNGEVFKQEIKIRIASDRSTMSAHQFGIKWGSLQDVIN